VRSFLNNNDYREIASVPLIIEVNMETNASEVFKLSHVHWQKRYFNPNSKTDIQDYKYFLDNNRWNGLCPFQLEWPYLTIVEMIRSKLIESHIEEMIVNAK
jgi:hypothetical protein